MPAVYPLRRIVSRTCLSTASDPAPTVYCSHLGQKVYPLKDFRLSVRPGLLVLTLPLGAFCILSGVKGVLQEPLVPPKPGQHCMLLLWCPLGGHAGQSTRQMSLLCMEVATSSRSLYQALQSSLSQPQELLQP